MKQVFLSFILSAFAFGDLSFLYREGPLLPTSQLIELEKKVRGIRHAEVLLVLYDRLELEHKIHQGNGYLKSILNRCGVAPEQDIVSICLLARLENLHQVGSLRRLLDLKQIADWQSKAVSSLSDSDRLYLEGRLHLRLPKGFGYDPVTALIRFNFLERVEGKSGVPQLWIAHCHRELGNRPVAESFYQEAADKKVVSAQSDIPLQNDGLSYGVSPALLVNPVVGLGGAVSVYDERLWDTARSVGVNFMAGTRGVFEAGAHYQDGELFSDFRVGIEGKYRYGQNDLYGGDARLHDSSVGGSVERDIVSPLRFSLGWNVASRNLVDNPNSFLSGPTARLSIDTRDSRYDPQVGSMAYVEGHFPTDTFGSDHSFEHWTLAAEQWVRVSSRLGARIHLGIDWVSDAAPAIFWPVLGERIGSLGVRENRYQNRSVGLGLFETRYQLFRAWKFGLFTMAAPSAAQPGDLLRGARWGGGLAAYFRVSRYRKETSRISASFLGGEFLFEVASEI